jgi:hypothetical protein
MDEKELRERLERARSDLKQWMKELFSRPEWERNARQRAGSLLAYALLHIEVLIELYEEYEESLRRSQIYVALSRVVELDGVPELQDKRQANLSRFKASFDEFDEMLAANAF